MRPIIYHQQSADDEDSDSNDVTSHATDINTPPQECRIQILSLLNPKQSKSIFLAKSEIFDSTSPQLNQNNQEVQQISLEQEDPLTQSQIYKKKVEEMNDSFRVVKFFEHNNSLALKKLKSEADLRLLLGKTSNKYFLKSYGMSQSEDPLILSDDNEQSHSFLNGHTFIVYEYCAQGSLLDLVISKNSSGTSENLSDEEKIKQVFKEVLEGVNILHNKFHQAHLNLRLNEVYIDSKGHAKIGGLQFSQSFDQIKEKQNLKKSQELHLQQQQYYQAPEFWNNTLNRQNGQRFCGDKIDVFSLGVMLFILMFKNPPFNKANPSEDKLYQVLCQSFESGSDQFFKIHPGTRRQKISNELKFLLLSMMQEDHSKRPTVHQILNNPWFVKKSNKNN